MSVLELKGTAHGLIAEIEDEPMLIQLVALLIKIGKKQIPAYDIWHALSASQQADLLMAIAEIDDDDNYATPQESSQVFEKWLAR